MTCINFCKNLCALGCEILKCFQASWALSGGLLAPFNSNGWFGWGLRHTSLVFVVYGERSGWRKHDIASSYLFWLTIALILGSSWRWVPLCSLPIIHKQHLRCLLHTETMLSFGHPHLCICHSSLRTIMVWNIYFTLIAMQHFIAFSRSVSVLLYMEIFISYQQKLKSV